MMNIRPGLKVKIVLETDHRTERADPRNSEIYDVDGDSVILAQAEPAIKSSMLNREIVVTYLAKEKHGHARYGFSAVITVFVDRYQLLSKQHVQALVVRKCSDPKPYNLRMWYRVQPTARSGLHVSVRGERVNVLDISEGGMRFSYDKSLELERNNVVEVCLGMAGAVHTIEARVIRTWETGSERFEGKPRIAAAEFLDVSARTEQAISRKIRDIERESLLARLMPA